MMDAQPDPHYWNADMAPVSLTARRWGVRDMAVLWISMSACIPTYMLASSLIAEGMNWWQAVLTIFLGNVIVLIPMVLNAHAGTKYGIPFPVYCRASFGLRGANIPALLRAFVACGWFGIQAWIGGSALFTILAVLMPEVRAQSPIGILGITPAEFGCFLTFWGLNVIVILRGIESIRMLLNIKAPLLILLGLMLLGWAYFAAGGFGEMLNQRAYVPPSAGATFWVAFAAGLTANVSYWATLSLNIPDFSRYARSQRDQAIGQIAGLPTTMALYAFIGVAVTSAAFVIYPGEDRSKLWDPVFLLNKFENKTVLIFSMLAISLATLATNIAANVVSPANDFANFWPRRIGFRIGGLITAIIGVLIMPWKLLADPSGYIFTWLIGISVLLGSVGGILIADYIVICRTRLDLGGLYRREGPYWYKAGFNPVALIALIGGIAPCVPGFLAKVDLIKVDGIWATIYTYAWFVSFSVSFAVYVIGMKLNRPRMYTDQHR